MGDAPSRLMAVEGAGAGARAGGMGGEATGMGGEAAGMGGEAAGMGGGEGDRAYVGDTSASVTNPQLEHTDSTLHWS